MSDNEAAGGALEQSLAGILQRLTRMEAVEAIKHVIARYTEGADRRNDPAIMGPLFTEEGVWEAAGFGLHVGRAVIAAALAEIARAQITWSVHFMVLPTITVGPDAKSATCQWYLWELAKIKGDDGVIRDSWFAAKYDSRLVLDSDGWQFEWLQLNPLLNSPVGEPWPGQVPT